MVMVNTLRRPHNKSHNFMSLLHEILKFPKNVYFVAKQLKSRWHKRRSFQKQNP